MTIIKYFELTKINPISRLKIAYMNYAELIYKETEIEEIKENAREVNRMSHLDIVKLFEKNRFIVEGCTCNSGAMRKKGSKNASYRY